MDLANGLPASPNFTSSELNLPMNALGGGGDTPTSGLMGGINPFGRAADNLTSPPEGEKERAAEKTSRLREKRRATRREQRRAIAGEKCGERVVPVAYRRSFARRPARCRTS